MPQKARTVGFIKVQQPVSFPHLICALAPLFGEACLTPARWDSNVDLESLSQIVYRYALVALPETYDAQVVALPQRAKAGTYRLSGRRATCRSSA